MSEESKKTTANQNSNFNQGKPQGRQHIIGDSKKVNESIRKAMEIPPKTGGGSGDKK